MEQCALWWKSISTPGVIIGRTHQIRVQFAAHGTPLVGDTKYGAPAAASVGRARREPLALCAVRLSFLHPVTGERMEFSTEPQFTL